MGGLTSLASTAIQAVSLASSLAGVVDKYHDKSGWRDYEEAKRKYETTMAGLQKQTALQKQENQLALAQDEEDRARRLRAALAKQRAIYGANGVGSGGGSSQAYLLGLVDESEGEGLQAREATDIKNRILDQEYSSKNALNMLEVTNAKERKKLKQISALF